VLLRQGGVLAASFHPELSEDDRVHELFLRQVAEGTTSGQRLAG
jgi:5'-phosphate synthase pdxT subunit